MTNQLYNISVLIPTHNRVGLLRKLLESIKVAELSDRIDTIYIIENGSEVSEELVLEYAGYFPVKYVYSEKGNKSSALNNTLKLIPENHFILFFDDDIEVTPNIFNLYESAIGTMGRGYYFGGPTGVNYEEEPLQELIKYMPASNIGTSQDLKEVSISNQDTFLGFNWGAFHQDLSKIGGFSEMYGPGSDSGARGQESEAQSRLLQLGIKPAYVPEAMVYHWVPKKNLTREWVMDRIWKSNILRGRVEGTLLKRVYWKIMYRYYSLLSSFSGKLEHEIVKNAYRGISES